MTALSALFDVNGRVEERLRARRFLDKAVPQRTDTLAERGPIAILDRHAELLEVLDRIGLDPRGPVPVVRGRLLHREQQAIPQSGLQALQRAGTYESAARGV